MNEIFCAPFAINSGSIEGFINEWAISIKAITFAPNIKGKSNRTILLMRLGWNSLNCLLESIKRPYEDEKIPTERSLKVLLKVLNGTVYYQPTSNMLSKGKIMKILLKFQELH